MDTWSSCLPEVGMVSTLAGCASTLFSLTRDAAVYWASMNPELVPASGARNGGRPRENAGSSIRSTRRSLMLRQLRERHGQHVGGERERLPVEVPGGHDLAVGDHDGVVHHRAELGVEHPAGKRQHVPDRAVHLRCAAQAVRVLDGVPAVPVTGQQRGARQQGTQVGRAVKLAGMRADHLHPLVIRPVGAQQRLDRQRARQVGGGRPASGRRWMENASSACIGSVPLTSDRPSLGASSSGAIPCSASTSAGRPACGGSPGPRSRPSPISGLRQVRELCQVSRRPDRALAGDDRQQVEVEQFDQPGRQFGAHTRVPGCKRSGAKEKYGADGGVAQWLTGGGRMRADDRALEAGQVLLPHPGVGERAEAGVDAVDGRIALDRRGDHGAAALHAGGDAGCQFGVRFTVRDVHDIGRRPGRRR